MRPLWLLVVSGSAVLTLAVLRTGSSNARAEAPGEALPVDVWVSVAPTAFSPALPRGPELLLALASRDHATALAQLDDLDPKLISGEQVANLAFLRAWELQRLGRGAEAVPLIDVIRKATDVPPAYANLVVGEMLVAAGRPVEAIPALEAVSGAGPIDVRARLALADAYQAASRESDARAVWTTLVSRPDPSTGSAEALWALAGKDGLSSGTSKAHVRRIYQFYPGSKADVAAAANPETRIAAPTLEDLSVRGDILQDRGSFAGAKALLADRVAEVPTNTPTGCRYRYAYGRAQHKLNNVTDAAAVLGPLGSSCKGVDDDRGAKALYVAGKSLERKKDWAGAAKAYATIPRNYPTHSMADDGYTLGGIALQEAGDRPGAAALWQAGFERYPSGDLAAETVWRLAWARWLDRDVPAALRWAEACADGIALETNPTDVLGCRYWAARWRAWPDPDRPAATNPDELQVADAVARFARLGDEANWHYYGILSASRLAQLSPGRAAFTRPPMDPPDAAWQVRDRWLHSTPVQNAMGLVRLGLVADAMVEFAEWDDNSLTGAEMAIVTGVQTVGGDFLNAHDRLRSYLKTHPPASLGPNTWKVMRQAYPQIWWPEVQTATVGYAWDPQLFHGLVREESNFNQQIKSHAGACGLSQLMPTTASGVASRMGLSFSAADIWMPATNLKIGAYYLNSLHKRYNGDSALTLAAYNAGEGNMDKWLALRPNAPLDEIVEAIPLRETRMYVKRVSSTWQTYRLVYQSEGLYVDWSRFLVDAVP
ncbi:MAG: tetratricopeptide repeat protein [Myxococcales bacterium]|nr:tetratricopeptide repeat protein [Myxococcales bacterium]